MRFRSPEGAALFNLALSLCFLFGLAASAYFLAKEQRDTDTLVRRSQELVSHVTQLQQLTLDAESTGRAYLLIADAKLLQRYEQMLPLIDRELTIMGGLLHDDPSAAASLDNIKRGVDTRYSYLTRLTKIRTAQGLDAVVTLASSGTGREEMAYVGSILTELKNGQNAQLREYLTQREGLMVQLWILTVAFVVAGLALALWVYYQTRQANANRESHDRQKEYMARHDALTALANRRHLQERLDAQIGEARRRNFVVALMYLDLDGFKEVNDTFGHDSGDELLVDVARRLRSALREDDVVARLGGDEFVVSLPHLHSAGDIGFVAEKLIDVLGAPYALEAGAAHVSVSIGVAMFPRDGDTPKALLVAADRALYAAKTAGKNRFHWASGGVRERTG
jgi:diguanylate cyclase (GGDEF)-like protein